MTKPIKSEHCLSAQVKMKARSIRRQWHSRTDQQGREQVEDKELTQRLLEEAKYRPKGPSSFLGVSPDSCRRSSAKFTSDPTLKLW